jgi:Threonine dehydrogenase and related Zn-dependent dehydrogenases
MSKMLVAVKPSVAGFKEYEDRKINPDEVKCKVLYAAPKHGTELVEFKGTSVHAHERYDNEWQLFFPRNEGEKADIVFGEWNLGNQWVGEVIEVGQQVTDFKSGDLICSYGGIRETHIVKAVNNYRCRKLNDKSLWKNALCYDPAQFALGGVRDGKVRPGDAVAVYGLGAIGQIAVQICKKLGAYPVIAIDPIGHRREIALKNGADYAFDPAALDVGLEMKKLTEKRGVDVIIETSGHVSSLQSGLRGLAYGGTISYVAFAKPMSGLELGREAHFNNARIIFSRACSEPLSDYPRWNRKRIEDTCWNMLTNGYLNCEDLIYPVVPFKTSDEAYMNYVDKNPQLSIKLGIEF